MEQLDADLEDIVARRVSEVAATLPVEKMGRAMGSELLATIPEFADTQDEDFRAGMVASCTDNLAAIQDVLVRRTSTLDVTPPPGAIAWAHELVHRGMSLAGLLRAYRLGHSIFEREFEQAASEIELEPDVRWRVLAATTRDVFAYIDSVCTQLVDDYETEREQWLRGSAAVQAELVQAIVAGEEVDPGEAEATLGHPLDAPQVAIVVWRDSRGRLTTGAVTGPSLSGLARQLATELGGTQTLIVPVGEHAAWAWTTGPELSDSLPTRSAALEDGVGAAAGGIHPGLEGMHRSHHEARAARRVGDLFGSRPGAIARYPLVALLSLATADPAQATNFVEAELGELGADTDAMLRLRATVRMYLEENLSPSRTARRVGIHQNTVTYRIKRAEELIGRPLEQRRLELEMALRLHAGLDALRAAG